MRKKLEVSLKEIWNKQMYFTKKLYTFAAQVIVTIISYKFWIENKCCAFGKLFITFHSFRFGFFFPFVKCMKKWCTFSNSNWIHIFSVLQTGEQLIHLLVLIVNCRMGPNTRSSKSYNFGFWISWWTLTQLKK